MELTDTNQPCGLTIIFSFLFFSATAIATVQLSWFLIYSFFGGTSEEVTPVPIPNTEVKLLSADGTARATGWESRTLPGIKCNPTPPEAGPGFFWR